MKNKYNKQKSKHIMIMIIIIILGLKGKRKIQRKKINDPDAILEHLQQ